jgi:hypothetical protein
MSAFSDYLEAAIINATLRGFAFPTPPTTVYLALFTVSPTDANTGGELTSGSSPGYARVAVPNNGWAAPSAGAGGVTTTSNINALEFPEATSNWAGPITHFGILDASTGGNLLYHGALTTPRSISAGDVLRFGSGALIVNIA